MSSTLRTLKIYLLKVLNLLFYLFVGFNITLFCFFYFIPKLGEEDELMIPLIPLTACRNSTIADSVICLLRYLHSYPAWTSLINNQIVSDDGYVAALAFLGGQTTKKPRIGGDVITQDGDFGNNNAAVYCWLLLLLKI